MKYLGCPLFENISDNDVNHMIQCFKAKESKYFAGEEICSYNVKTGTLGIILSGKASVKKLDRNGNYSILENLQRFDVYSDSFSYTANDDNYISVVSEDDVITLEFSFDEVYKRCEKACKHHSILVQNLMKIVIDKTKTLSQRVEILSNKSIKDKVLGYIKLMLSKNNQKDTFTLTMSYTSLAEYLCVDRSALMREIKKLKEQNVIKVNKKTITLLNDKYI